MYAVGDIGIVAVVLLVAATVVMVGPNTMLSSVELDGAVSGVDKACCTGVVVVVPLEGREVLTHKGAAASCHM